MPGSHLTPPRHIYNIPDTTRCLNGTDSYTVFCIFLLDVIAFITFCTGDNVIIVDRPKHSYYNRNEQCDIKQSASGQKVCCNIRQDTKTLVSIKQYRKWS